MKRTATGSIAAIALLGVAIWFFQAGTSSRPNASEAKSTIDGAPAAQDQGMRVYRDPVTGQFIPRPEGLVEPEFPKDLNDPLSTSGEGLEIKPAPGGGVMMDLQGRFQNTATVNVDAQGKPVISCDTENPATKTDEKGEE
jgi:hypothetical protein